jgi:hypothetical protein
MNANNLSKHFLLWFQQEYQDARIHRNNRGMYKIGKRCIRYGIPTPQGKGKDQLKGTDFISFHAEYCIIKGHDGKYFQKKICISKFWEIKTLTDDMAEGQINFLNQYTEMGAECFIVHEIREKPYFKVEKWSVK